MVQKRNPFQGLCTILIQSKWLFDRPMFWQTFGIFHCCQKRVRSVCAKKRNKKTNSKFSNFRIFFKNSENNFLIFCLPVVQKRWPQIQWQSKHNSPNGNHAKLLGKSMHPIGLNYDYLKIVNVCTHIRQPNDWFAHWNCRYNVGIVLYFQIPAI